MLIENIKVLIPLSIWTFAFCFILIKYNKKLKNKDSFITRLLSNKYLQKLGEISYLTYLSHVIVVFIAQWYILKINDVMGKYEMLIMLTSLTVPFTILVSTILSNVIEKPCIDFGKRFVKRMNGFSTK